MKYLGISLKLILGLSQITANWCYHGKYAQEPSEQV
jgi:hypothetical protein